MNSIGPLGLPDSESIRTGASKTPFFPDVYGNFTASVLSIARRDGFRGGDAFWIRVRILTSDQPAILPGSDYCFYRKVGDTPIKREMTAQYLCSIITAMGFDVDGWQVTLQSLLTAGEELAALNRTIAIQQRPSNNLKDDGTPWVQTNFSRAQ